MEGSKLPHAAPFVSLAAHRMGVTNEAPQGLARTLPFNLHPSQFCVHRSLCLGETLIVPNTLIQCQEEQMSGRSEERQQRLWVARHRVEAESRQRERLKETMKPPTMRNNQTPRVLWLERT